jgi:hypothetical protein
VSSGLLHDWALLTPDSCANPLKLRYLPPRLKLLTRRFPCATVSFCFAAKQRCPGRRVYPPDPIGRDGVFRRALCQGGDDRENYTERIGAGPGCRTARWRGKKLMSSARRLKTQKPRVGGGHCHPARLFRPAAEVAGAKTSVAVDLQSVVNAAKCPLIAASPDGHRSALRIWRGGNSCAAVN